MRKKQCTLFKRYLYFKSSWYSTNHGTANLWKPWTALTQDYFLYYAQYSRSHEIIMVLRYLCILRSGSDSLIRPSSRQLFQFNRINEQLERTLADHKRCVEFQRFSKINSNALSSFVQKHCANKLRCHLHWSFNSSKHFTAGILGN